TSIAISTTLSKERAALAEIFEEAYENCRKAPLEGVSFSLEQLTETVDKYGFASEIGNKACPFLWIMSFSQIIIGVNMSVSVWFPGSVIMSVLHSRIKWPLRMGQCNARRRLRNQHDSETTLTTPWYLASALERDNVGCRLEDQESRLSPRNTITRGGASGV
ncbi:30S ribosomal protein S1 chloroplastic-like, partial [Trifolium medium]|nr:30S ribosomal protein S1 chloroplastic-like [Trifolium medium]